MRQRFASLLARLDGPAPVRASVRAEPIVRWAPVAALAVCVMRHAFLVPDGIEMAAAGRCAWRAAAAGANIVSTCADHELLLWPPLLPAIAGLLALVVGPVFAPLLVSLGAAAAVARGVADGAARLTDIGGLSARRGLSAAFALAVLLASPLFRAQAVTGDGRLLAMALLIAAWARLDDATRPRDGWVAGALAGAAALARPEALLGAGLVVAGAWVARRARAVGATLGAGLVVAPWVLTLSEAYGRVTVLARSWESAVYPWAESLPVSWLVPLLGLGTGGTPLRHVLAATAPGAPAGDPARVWSVPPGLRDAAPIAALLLAAPLCLVAVRGLSAAARAPGGLRAALRIVVATQAYALVPVLLAGPALGAAFLPQAQVREIPGANLVAVVVSGAMLAGSGALLLTDHLGPWVRGALERYAPADRFAVAAPWAPAAALITAIALGPAAAPEWSADMDPAWDRAGTWIAANVPVGSRVAASLYASSIVHRADRPRAGLPSVWEVWPWLARPDAPRWLVTTTGDVTAASLVFADLSDAATWRLAFADDGPFGAVRIFERTDRR